MIDFKEFWSFVMEHGKGHAEDPVLNAHKYMTKHNIVALFESMAAALMFDKPEDPRAYLSAKLSAYKADGTAVMPYTNDDLETMFGMFDMMGKGSIKAAQANEAMKVLTGISGSAGKGGPMYDPSAPVMKDDFVKLAKDAL